MSSLDGNHPHISKPSSSYFTDNSDGSFTLTFHSAETFPQNTPRLSVALWKSVAGCRLCYTVAAAPRHSMALVTSGGGQQALSRSGIPGLWGVTMEAVPWDHLGRQRYLHLQWAPSSSRPGLPSHTWRTEIKVLSQFSIFCTTPRVPLYWILNTFKKMDTGGRSYSLTWRLHWEWTYTVC